MKALDLRNQIKQLYSQGDKPQAAKLLQRMKQLNQHVEDQVNRKGVLDGILMNIETANNNKLMVDSLKVAKEAGEQRESLGGGQSMCDNLEELMSELKQQ